MVLCLTDCHVIQMAVLSCTEVPHEMLVCHLGLPLDSQVLDNVVVFLQGGVFESLHLHAVLGPEALVLRTCGHCPCSIATADA